jgi:hypothetical protein
MSDLQKAYDAWPQEVKDEFWKHLRHIFLWRGWDKGIMGRNPRYAQVDAMAKLFWEHGGVDIEEYT